LWRNKACQDGYVYRDEEDVIDHDVE